MSRIALSSDCRPVDPMHQKMKYEPSTKPSQSVLQRNAHKAFTAQKEWIRFLIDRFETISMRNIDIVHIYLRMLQLAFKRHSLLSHHPLVRDALFGLLQLGFKVLRLCGLDALCEQKFRSQLYSMAFSWFASDPR